MAGWWREALAELAELTPGPVVRAGLAKRLTVPLPRPGLAGRRSPSAVRLAPAVRRSLPATRLGPAVSGPPVPMRLGPGGALSLAELLGEGAGSGVPRALWDERRTGASVGPVRPSTPADEELPLWKRLSYLLRPSVDLLLASDGPLEWPAPFFPYQLEGIRALLERDALLLADDMGLGKTVQASAALRVLALQRQIQRALLIVPAGLVSQWRQALGAWAPQLLVSTVRGPAMERAWQWRAPAHIYLTSYESLREDFTASPHSPPRRWVWDVVVLDEAQRIKNPFSEISRKCKLLWRRRAWALTGTPLENSLDDLASVLEFTTPLLDGQRPEVLLPGRTLFKRQLELQLRRRKEDVLPQLPPKLVGRIVLPLSGPQRESYDRAERGGMRQLSELGPSVRLEHVFELITRLKQICNVDPASGRSAKLDDLEQRLATLTAEGHRALVFSQFADARFGARAIGTRLTRFRPLVYTGELSPRQRDELLDQFRTNPEHRLLVLSLRAGGQGLNLQEASYVFHLDRWWNPAVERQAEDRSHRLGQTKPVHVYSYICEETIEERIDAILRAKERLFADLVDEVSLDPRTALSGSELLGLFGLARG